VAKGQIYPSESRRFVDERTGAEVRQVTAFEAIHHHPFFTAPAYDDAGTFLVFISHRTGTPQLFAEVRATGDLLQLTARDDLGAWSIHPSHDGRFVYFAAGAGGWRVEIATGREERIVDFRTIVAAAGAPNSGLVLHEAGVIAAMGTTSLSQDDRWWAAKIQVGSEHWLVIIDTSTWTAEVVLRRDMIAHVQFCPDDSEVLFYAGPLTDRVWVIRRDGTGNRRLYQRPPGAWITHESWIPGRRELAFVDWPNGVGAVSLDHGSVRTVASFNAWHTVSNADGTAMVADTNFPDIGLQLFDPGKGEGHPVPLCHPDASSIGAHWNGPFPYDHGPISVYAPQHTHPHPTFSHDGRHVAFTSDRSGFAQVHEVAVPGVFAPPIDDPRPARQAKG
jgi:oligogalacturonide lyase